MVNRVLVFGLFLVILSCPLQAQSWKDKYLQSQAAYEKESYDQAFALENEALNGYMTESGAVNDNYAAILRLLSTICYAHQKLPEGLEYINKELKVREAKKDTAYAVALSNKAQFEEQMGKSGDAVKTLLECRTILTQYYKED